MYTDAQTDTFTHGLGRFQTQALLHILHIDTFVHTDLFSRTHFHTSMLLHTHTHAFTHSRFYTQTFLHRPSYTPAHLRTDFLTSTLLHTVTFKHTETLTHTHTNPFTCRPLRIHRRFYRQTLLQTDPFTHRDVYTQTLLHTDALTQQCFAVLLRTTKLAERGPVPLLPKTSHQELPGTAS